MAHTLPALPWGQDALAPKGISKETIEFHYGKHHNGYVTTLNGLVEGTPDAEKSLEELVKTADGKLFNISAQHWNHSFYWKSLAPNGGGEATGAIAEAIAAAYGNFENFKTEFATVAAGHFGSGWAWLVYNPNEKKVQIVGTHDAGNPIRENLIPLITCDVWEHAYYIDFRNARPEYIKAWWSLVNWEFANENLAAATK